MASSIIRIVVTGGGTGGHLSPAVATIQALQKQVPDDDLELLYIGSRDGTESRAIPVIGIRYKSVSTGKLRRYFSLENAVDALRVPLGIAQSLFHILRFGPNVVFATGGYVSVPPVIAAWMLRKPVVVHEQTGTLGLANRINARFAKVIALSFPDPEGGSVHKPMVVTGNPIRGEVLRGDRTEALRRFQLDERLPTVYITGGAQGAHVINETVQEALPSLLSFAQVIHQCGDTPGTKADYETLLRTVKELPNDLQNRYVLLRYIGQEIGQVYAACDLVVGRAGAGTVNEVATLGKPAVFIPLPNTAGDEQVRNARRLRELGAATVIEQRELTAEILTGEIRRLLSDREALQRMSKAGKSAGSIGADERLAELVLQVARGSYRGT